ncbi:MAG: ferredoxin [Nanoarchaeota archaeon]|nr:ferredoxin [Nanoarchaeota archaeon]
MAFKIEFNKDGCIGCGACASVCADNWDMVEEDAGYKAKLKNDSVDELGCNKEAAEVCPVKVIIITET